MVPTRRRLALTCAAALLAATLLTPATAQQRTRCVVGSPTNTCPPGSQCCGTGYCGVPCGANGECQVCCELGTYTCATGGQCVAAPGLCQIPGLGVYPCASGYQCSSQRGAGCVAASSATNVAGVAPGSGGRCPLTGQPPCGGTSCCASSAVCIAGQCVPRALTIPSPATPGGFLYCAPGYLAGYSSTGTPACVSTSYACGAAPGGAPPQCCGSVANVCLGQAREGPCCTPESTCGGVNGLPQFCCAPPGGCIRQTGQCCATALCNGVCCPGGTACAGGTCCAPANQCGDSCCAPGVPCQSGQCCESPSVPCGQGSCCSPGSSCLPSGTCCQGTPCGTSGCCTAGQVCSNGACSSPAPPPPPPQVAVVGYAGGPYYGGYGNPYSNAYGGCLGGCPFGLTCVYSRCVRVGGYGYDGRRR